MRPKVKSKMLNREKSDFKYLKFLYRVAYVLAMIPPIISSKRLKHTNYKCRAVFVALIIFLSYFYTANIVPHKIGLTTQDILYRIAFTVSTVLLVNGIIRTAFCNIKLFNCFIADLRRFNKHQNVINCYQYYAEIAAMHVVYIFTISLNASTVIPFFGILGASRYLFKCLQDYFIAVIALLIYNYCKIIRNGFERLNDNLSDNFRMHLEERHICIKLEYQITDYYKNDFRSYCLEDYKIIYKVTRARKTYGYLSNLITLYNEAFGWHIVTILGVATLAAVEMIDWEIAGFLYIKTKIVLYLWVIFLGVSN